MKSTKAKGKLKIDPSVVPLHKKELFSTLNYLEAGAVVLGIGILILVLVNIGGEKSGNLDNTKEYSQTETNSNSLSSEENQAQLEARGLDDIKKQPTIKPLSPEESQQHFDALSKLRNQ